MTTTAANTWSPSHNFPPENALAAEIKRLQDKLAALQPPATAPRAVVFDSSPFEPATLAHVLTDLGGKKFGTGGRINVTTADGTVIVHGDKEVADWAVATVKSMVTR